jgi:predicted hotdog family 3-hydroxylacyl-ACP dehydratase
VKPLLEHAQIEARIPHRGPMCLLEALWACDAQTIRCTATAHTSAAHPLRSASGLLAPAAIEIASQAMALHGALNAPPGEPPRAGFLASARQVKMHCMRLDEAPGPLAVQATLLAGDPQQALYRFELRDGAGRLLVEGRAAVILDGSLAPTLRERA